MENVEEILNLQPKGDFLLFVLQSRDVATDGEAHQRIHSSQKILVELVAVLFHVWPRNEI